MSTVEVRLDDTERQTVMRALLLAQIRITPGDRNWWLHVQTILRKVEGVDTVLIARRKENRNAE